MITIAVDAMGGDHAPQAEVEGAVQAAREYGLGVLLAGVPDVLQRELGRFSTNGLRVELLPAREIIAMDDHPVKAMRRKRDSSLHVAVRAVREGRADGLVTAGNTGAAMAVTKTEWGTVPGVDRPACRPTGKGRR